MNKESPRRKEPAGIFLTYWRVNFQWANNFDHHQLERGTCECAFSLVAKELGVDAQLREFFPWFTTWRMIDSCGPFQWAKEFGINSWDVVKGLLSPVNDLIHDWWEENDETGLVDPALCARLLKIGRKILESADKFREFCDRADQWSHPEFSGVPVMDFTWASPDEALEFGDAYARARGIGGGVLVSRDNRGPGFALFRREDDSRVNFSLLEGNPEVTFAHKGGFIAKTTEGADWAQLVQAAITA